MDLDVDLDTDVDTQLDMDIQNDMDLQMDTDMDLGMDTDIANMHTDMDFESSLYWDTVTRFEIEDLSEQSG